MKDRYNFRLSPEASALLQAFVRHYGLTKTDIIELALRRLAQYPLLPPKEEQADAHA